MYLEKYYGLIAPHFDKLVTIGSLCAFPRLHQRAAEALSLASGDTVLDLCCGTGMMIPFLREKVGGRGRVIGVDFSPQMIKVASQKARREKWSNVELVCEDVKLFTPPEQVAGVLFSISLTSVPDCEKVLERSISFLQPSKKLVVVDAFLNSGKWQYHLANLYTRMKAPIVGSVLDNKVRQTALSKLTDPQIEVAHGGLYSLISGRRPELLTADGN